ncbi:hypothetical protein F4825DRAFT_322052 [Nemania diffusa]|nr:hypothetical protein F4825DRAFT_322052 [Nemania diffusa]
MGNTPSVEAPGKGSKAAQKLSKPRIGNPATAGLLNPSGVSDIIRRPPSLTTGRRLSLPYSSTTPIPSPRHPETEQTAPDDLAALYGAPGPTEEYSHLSFQPDPQASHQGSQGVDVVASSSRSRRTSRTNSVYMGAGQGYQQLQLDLLASPRNYDLSAYEAQQLLNFVDDPSFEDQSVISESQLPIALSRRQSYTTSYHPVHPDAATLLPRNNSDASLYTPMRRRSLMTPGVATRPVPVDLVIPPDIQTGDIPTPPPPRSNSPGFMAAGLLSIPHSSFDPNLVPRAHTPCDTEYQHTGAFKHGTLRITNGSPVMTPAWETADPSLHAKSSTTTIRQGNYFDDRNQAQEKQNGDSDEHPVSSSVATASSITSTDYLAVAAGDQEFALSFLPELKLTWSPFSISGTESELPELQTTSKHTAMEDELFEDGSSEYGTEALNVRLDHAFKTHSSPIVPLEEGKQREISRSDSGIAASPTPSAPHNSLSKADSGYSSSVSIRSLSTKRQGQQEFSHSHSIGPISPQVPAFDNTKQSGQALLGSNLTTIGSPDLQFKASLLDGPPPVPQKDHPKGPKSVIAIPNDSRVITRKPSLVSNGASAGETPESVHHSALGFDDSVTPISTRSISNARKPGRLQRLLSGARAPLAAYVTHATEREAAVPPVPQIAPEKLHEHAGLSPNSLGSYYESTDAKNDGSASATVSKASMYRDQNSTVQEDNGPSTRTNQDKIRGFRSNFHINSISSKLTRVASSVMAKNPIHKKSMLTRTRLDDQDITSSALGTPTATQHPSDGSQWHPRGIENLGSGKDRYGRPIVTTGRSNSISVSTGSLDPRMYDDARRSTIGGQSEPHTVAFQKPSFPGQYSVSRTPPPVSMKTRNIGPLRVPPPIRPRSTPPARSGAPTLSRKPSREGVQSYPPYHYPMNVSHAAVPRPSSQESFYTYSAAQIQAFLNQPTQMPGNTTIRPSSAQYNLGGYRTFSDVSNSKHGRVPSWDPSFDHSRRNSLASQTSQRSALSNTQAWPHYAPYDKPTLRHRSSYDGYSFQAQQSHGKDNGPYPPLPLASGQAYMSDPLRGQPMLNQPIQYQQHTRYVSRGHLRHHSLDQYGSPVPYRVLHSYNSPAYRGVPIWSG